MLPGLPFAHCKLVSARKPRRDGRRALRMAEHGTSSSVRANVLLDPRQQGRHRARIRWGIVQQTMASPREQHDGEILAPRLAQPLERGCALLRGLRTILAAVDPDPGHGDSLEERNGVEAGGMQLPRDLGSLLNRERRWAGRVLAGELAPLLLLMRCHGRAVGHCDEPNALLRTHDRQRDDPARLARAEEPNPCWVDLRALPQSVDGAVRVGREQIEMALVAGTASALRFTYAALVIGEELDPPADDLRHPGHIPPPPLRLTAAVH